MFAVCISAAQALHTISAPLASRPKIPRGNARLGCGRTKASVRRGLIHRNTLMALGEMAGAAASWKAPAIPAPANE